MSRALLKSLVFLLSLSSLSAFSFQGRVALGGGAFATPWENYRNTWAVGNIHLESSPEAGKSLSYSADVLYRSDSTMPVLGNIGELLYKVNDSVSLGRASPSLESSLVSLDRSLNHRVCQTPLECALGGSIGAHYGSPSIRLSLELVSLPNISPNPQLSSNGTLSSDYRWSDTPYQFVEVGGAKLPLRVTSSVDVDATTLFTPGLVAEKTFDHSSSFKTLVRAATQRSKSPRNNRSDGLLVIEDPEEGLIAVANSHQQLSFPWQHVLLTSSQFQISDSTVLGFDLGTRVSHENSYESALSLEHTSGPWLLKTSLGWHRQGAYEFLSAIPGATYKNGILQASLEAQVILAQGAESLLLRPELRYALRGRSALFAKGLLVSADKGERLFAKNRAADSFLLGVEYVF